MIRKLLESKILSTGLSITLSFLLVTLITYSASTISTNITTGGSLTVSGASTFGDEATDVNLFTGTLQASTTSLFTSGLTSYGNSTFGDATTDVTLFTGTLQASTTALFTSGFTSFGLIQASSTSANLLINGFATTTASNGNIETEGTLTVERGIATSLGVASTSPSQELGVVGDIIAGSGATTTLILSSSLANTGGCIQLEGA